MRSSCTVAIVSLPHLNSRNRTLIEISATKPALVLPQLSPGRVTERIVVLRSDPTVVVRCFGVADLLETADSNCTLLTEMNQKLGSSQDCRGPASVTEEAKLAALVMIDLAWHASQAQEIVVIRRAGGFLFCFGESAVLP